LREDELLIIGQFFGIKECENQGEGDVLALGTELVCEHCGTIHAVQSVLQALLIPLLQWRAILPFRDTNSAAELLALIFALGRCGKAVEHLIFHRVDLLVFAYFWHDLRAVGAQVISPVELDNSVALLVLLLRRVQEFLELRCTGAFASKINCAAGCLLTKLFLIQTTIRNQGCRF